MKVFIPVACGLCGYIFNVCLSVRLSFLFSDSPYLSVTRSIARPLACAHVPGLPAGVLISFVWVLAGLTIGWLAIGIHQYTLTNAAVKAVQVGWGGMWRTNNVERA